MTARDFYFLNEDCIHHLSLTKEDVDWYAQEALSANKCTRKSLTRKYSLSAITRGKHDIKTNVTEHA